MLPSVHISPKFFFYQSIDILHVVDKEENYIAFLHWTFYMQSVEERRMHVKKFEK